MFIAREGGGEGRGGGGSRFSGKKEGESIVTNRVYDCFLTKDARNQVFP